MAAFLKRIWRSETLFLDCEDLRDLVRCQWNINPKLWMAYRLFTGFYVVLVLVWAFVVKYMKYQFKFFTFMSHWSYLAFVISFVFRLIGSMKYYRWTVHPSEEHIPLISRSPSWIPGLQNRSPWVLQASWLLSNIANPLSIHITYGYWKDITSVTPVSEALNFQIHGVNAIFVSFDALVAATPTYILHVYQPVTFYLTYVIFTAFYKVAGGTDKNGRSYIYENMNWDYPVELAYGSLEAIGFIVLFHLGFWLLWVVRSVIEDKLRTKTQV